MTTIHILGTLVRPDGGTVRIDGHDLQREAAAVRRVVSLTGQFAAVDNLLTGRESLTMMAKLWRVPRAARRTEVVAALERFDLTEAANRLVGTYSGGMRRKLDIAISVLARPKLLFLDEPTTGPDPRSRRETWRLVRELVSDGTTVVLTTQYLDEADQLADRVAVLDHGRIIANGTPAALKRRVDADRVEVEYEDGNTSSFPTDGTPAAIRVALERIEAGGAPLLQFAYAHRALTMCFFRSPENASKGSPTAPRRIRRKYSDERSSCMVHVEPFRYRPLYDSLVMTGRSMHHAAREIDVLLTGVMMPVLLMVLMTVVFGGAMQTGEVAYIDYVVPGVILLCAGHGASLTAVSVARDMSEGIVDRFRTMSVFPLAVLIGHVVASLMRNLASTGLVVATALLMGFRPSAGPVEWLVIAGVLLLFILAMSWIATLVGLVLKRVETASILGFF